jgi:2-oxoglutarate ferredoxin oxidoreductase subunit beta
VAVLDIISPCVTFNNQDNATHSYTWGKDHEAPLHDISFIPAMDEIEILGEFPEGTVREVSMHDGSTIILKKIEKDYDPTNRANVFQMLESAQMNNWLVTGLLYIDESKPSLVEAYNLVDTPLNRLADSELRPAPGTIDKINAMMF